MEIHGAGQPTVSLHKVSTVQRLGLPSARLHLPSSPDRVTGPPSVTAQGVDCEGALPLASLLLCHSLGHGARPPTVSRHEVLTVQVRCFLPVSFFVTHGRIAGSGHPQCHGTRCQLCADALHQVQRSSFPCIPSGLAGVTRIRTF